jgi:hypothetical protein
MRNPIESSFVPALSPDGERRRDEILRVTQHFSARKRRRRAAFRVGALAVLCAGIWFAFPRQHPRNPHQIAIPIAPANEKPAASIQDKFTAPLIARSASVRPPITITRIQTDRLLASRFAIPRQSPTWQKIGDEVLLKSLADAGRPAGLQYADGREIILFRGK